VQRLGGREDRPPARDPHPASDVMSRPTWRACAGCDEPALLAGDLCRECRFHIVAALVLGAAVVLVVLALVREGVR
jgi:hypothetical protein